MPQIHVWVEDVNTLVNAQGHRDEFRRPDEIEEILMTPPQPSSVSSSASLRSPAAAHNAFSLAPLFAATGGGGGSSLFASTGGDWKSLSEHAQPQTEDGVTPADVAPEGDAETLVVTEALPAAAGITGGQEDAPTQLGHGEQAFSIEVRPRNIA